MHMAFPGQREPGQQLGPYAFVLQLIPLVIFQIRKTRVRGAERLSLRSKPGRRGHRAQSGPVTFSSYRTKSHSLLSSQLCPWAFPTLTQAEAILSLSYSLDNKICSHLTWASWRAWCREGSHARSSGSWASTLIVLMLNGSWTWSGILILGTPSWMVSS